MKANDAGEKLASPPGGRRSRWTLTTRFAVMSSLLAGFAIVAVGIPVWLKAREDLARQHDLRVSQEATIISEYAAGVLNSITSTMNAVADNSVLATALVDSSGRETYLLPFLSGFQTINGIPVGLAFTDFEAKLIGTNGRYRPSANELAWLARAMAGQEYPAKILTEGGETYLLAAEMIVYARTMSPEGAVLYRFPLSSVIEREGVRVVHGSLPPLPGSREDSARIFDAPISTVELLKPLHLAVRIAAPADDVTPSVPRITLIYGAASVLVMVVIFLLSRVMGRRLTEELHRLAGFAESVVIHGFSARRVEVSRHDRDEVSQVARAVNYMLDELQRLYSQLADRSRRRFELILTSAGEGIYGIDRDGYCTFVNQAASRMLGWTTDELIGVHNHETFHHSRPDGTPYPYQDCPVYLAVKNGEAQSLASDVFWRKDGSPFPVEYTTTPIEEDGAITGAVVVFHDISERKKAEEELRKLSTAVEQSPMSVVITDPKGIIQYVNPRFSEVTGYSADEAIGQTPRLLKSGTTPQECYETLWRTISSGEVWHGEFHNRKKDGSLYWEAASISPIKTADGAISHYLAVKEDITERKRAQQALADSNRELESFVYIVSHDLQEPLRTVGSFVKLLRDRYEGRLDAEADEFIGFAVEGTERMSTMIRDLVEFSRVGTHGKDLRPVDSGVVAREAIANLRTAIDEAKGQVTVADSLPMVHGDRSQLVRLFQNLIGNAIKYRDPSRSPAVHIDVARHGGDWEFSIADNGIGIAAKYHEKIFMVFKRLHGRSRYEGTGIGLAVVKKIVERHGGRIRVESAPGTGSRFLFTLPVHGNEEQPSR